MLCPFAGTPTNYFVSCMAFKFSLYYHRSQAYVYRFKNFYHQADNYSIKSKYEQTKKLQEWTITLFYQKAYRSYLTYIVKIYSFEFNPKRQVLPCNLAPHVSWYY